MLKVFSPYMIESEDGFEISGVGYNKISDEFVMITNTHGENIGKVYHYPTASKLYEHVLKLVDIGYGIPKKCIDTLEAIIVLALCEHLNGVE